MPSPHDGGGEHGAARPRRPRPDACAAGTLSSQAASAVLGTCRQTASVPRRRRGGARWTSGVRGETEASGLPRHPGKPCPRAERRRPGPPSRGKSNLGYLSPRLAKTPFRGETLGSDPQPLSRVATLSKNANSRGLASLLSRVSPLLLSPPTSVYSVRTPSALPTGAARLPVPARSISQYPAA